MSQAPHSDARDTVELLRRVAAEHPEVDAFVEADGTRISYGAWDRAADGIAAGLVRHGVRAGDVVCLMLPSTIRYMLCYQAAMRLGAVTTGLNQRLGRSEIEHVMTLARPAVVIVDGDGPQPPAGAPVLPWSRLRAHSREPAPELPSLRRDDVVVLCWTGGTTGRPKGVEFDHGNLAAVAAAAGPLSARFDRRLSPLSFAHVGTMTRAWDEISRVMTTVITPPRWTAADALRLIGTERVTVAQGVPTQWELMLRHPDLATTDTSRLRLAATGGSRVPVDLVRRIKITLGVPIINRYASTEACVISGTRPGDPDRVVFETVGRPGEGIEIRLVDDDGEPVGTGHIGRIQVRSAAVMRGYWRDPAATAAAITADGWLTVGDLGTFDDDGNLRVVGRLGEMFVRGGYNIYPIEVEQVLAEHAAVVQASVVARPDTVLGEAGVAFVVLSAEAGADELRSWVRERLADYKVPDDVVVVDELPLTPLGKVDRRELSARTESLAR
jgi:acyl-CoA synthetase (AMP-forming)/AMP-acid ligase II